MVTCSGLKATLFISTLQLQFKSATGKTCFVNSQQLCPPTLPLYIFSVTIWLTGYIFPSSISLFSGTCWHFICNVGDLLSVATLWFTFTGSSVIHSLLVCNLMFSRSLIMAIRYIIAVTCAYSVDISISHCMCIYFIVMFIICWPPCGGFLNTYLSQL